MGRWNQPQGLCRRSDGRLTILCRDGSQVLYYRAVVEASLRRHLRREEIVHHKNGDPTDDRLDNLEVVESHRAHAHLHGHSWRNSRWADRRCRGCGCDHDDRTVACKHCQQRHYRRAQVAA